LYAGLALPDFITLAKLTFLFIVELPSDDRAADEKKTSGGNLEGNNGVW